MGLKKASATKRKLKLSRGERREEEREGKREERAEPGWRKSTQNRQKLAKFLKKLANNKVNEQQAARGGGVATVAGKWTRMENEMENFVPTTIFGADSLCATKNSIK